MSDYSGYSYKTRGHVVYRCTYHVIWCTKYRRNLIDRNVEQRLREIAYETAEECSFEIVEMGVEDDHVHLLLDVPPQVGVAKAVRRIKGRSSRLLRQEFPQLRTRVPTLWTRSYFCSTVGGAPLAVVKKYVENQRGV